MDARVPPCYGGTRKEDARKCDLTGTPNGSIPKSDDLQTRETFLAESPQRKKTRGAADQSIE